MKIQGEKNLKQPTLTILEKILVVVVMVTIFYYALTEYYFRELVDLPIKISSAARIEKIIDIPWEE